jgi:hypothetical protein
MERAGSFLRMSGAPRFETTIPSDFAHKRAVEEVFLTDTIVDLSRERVLAGAQLPRNHALHNEVENGIHDLLLLLEIARQGMTIYGHVRLAVPRETAFVMSELRVEVLDLEAIRQADAPAGLVFDVPFGEEQRDRRGRARGYALKGTGSIDGRLSMEMAGKALLIPEGLYERMLRVPVGKNAAASSPPPQPVEPASVGRRSPRNVVVGDVERDDEELRCALLADTTHPSFFDHPLDHVPGMLMLEAARQAALLYVGGLGWSPTRSVLDACEAHFGSYAALSPPAICRVRRCDPFAADPAQSGDAPAEHLRVRFSQVETDIGYIDMRLRRVDGG